MEEFARNSSQFFLRVSDEWFRSVHNKETRNFDRCWANLRSMDEDQRASSLERGGNKKPAPEAAKFFQTIIFDNVTAGNEKLKALMKFEKTKKQKNR